jgi:HEAT repeat protein
MRGTIITLGAALAVTLVLGAAGPAGACKCIAPPPPLAALGSADGVFSGQVIRRGDPLAEQTGVSSLSPIDYIFRVEDVWKGDIGDSVVVRTARASASCGYPFEVDEAYLVYATRDSIGWRTDLCTRTTGMEWADDDLAAFAGADLTGSTQEIEDRLVRDAIDRLSSEEESVRVEAAAALEDMGHRPDLAMPALIDLYGRGTEADRRAAVSALGWLAWNHPDAVDAMPTLFTALRDPSVDVRQVAIHRLSMMQHKAEALVPRFEEALGDASASVRGEAARSLERMYMLGYEGTTSVAPLLAALESEDEAVRAAVLRALALIGPDSQTIPLVARVLAEDPSPDARTSAISSLNALEIQSEEVTVLLVKALGDPDDGVRAEAALGLAKSGVFGGEAVPALRLARDDPSARVRDFAVVALADLSPYHEEAWSELLAALHHEIPDVRASAANRIAPRGEARNYGEAVIALEGAMRDTSYEVLRAASNGLGRLAPVSPDAVAILVESLSNESADIRLLICAVLGRAGPSARDAIPALTALENDPDPQVRDQALWALTRIQQQ